MARKKTASPIGRTRDESVDCPATVARFEERFDKIDLELKRLNQAVFTGNGKPSVLARLEAIESRLGTITRLLWAVITAVIGALVRSFF